MKRSVAVLLFGALASLGAISLLQAGCSGGTGSKRFAFEARVGGSEGLTPGPLTFTNQTGWGITLTKADVTVGPVYLNVAPPLREATQGFLELLVKSAWADGEAHLGAGRVVGEVLGQVTFSALSSTLVPLPVQGTLTQEEVRTADIWFYPEPGLSPDTTKIDTVALDVAGVATRNGAVVRFRGALTLNDAWQPDAPAGARGALSIAEIRKVRGIPAGFFPTEGGRLDVRVNIERMFRGADFSNLEQNPSDKDGTKVLIQAKTGKLTSDQVMINLYQGLRAANGTYSVRWTGP